MSPRNEVIDDSTDPGGTLRPNLPPEPTVGTHFTPLKCPQFKFQIALPLDVDVHDPVAIFDLFFTQEQMHILVENTNKAGPYWHQIGPRNARALKWRDTSINELYTYLAILIYMGLYPENEIEQYWCTDIDNVPSHGPVRTGMARDRFKQISRAFHISDQGDSAFQKVCTYLLLEYFTNNPDR
jgi:hypothetical protein